MAINKDSTRINRKHKYLDNQITRLEKHNSINRTLITDLKKKKLKLKDKMISEQRERSRINKRSLHNAMVATFGT